MLKTKLAKESFKLKSTTILLFHAKKHTVIFLQTIRQIRKTNPSTLWDKTETAHFPILTSL